MTSGVRPKPQSDGRPSHEEALDERWPAPKGWRLVLWALALVVVTLAGDRLLSTGLQRVLMHSEFRFSRVYRGGVDADVLVLGNSRGVNSFDAPAISRATGMRTFNASYNGMSPVLQEVVLNDYLQRNRAPRLLVLEVTSVDAGPEALKDVRLYRTMSPGLKTLDARSNPRLARASDVMHLLNFNNPLFLRALFYLKRTDQDWSNRATLDSGTLETISDLTPFPMKILDDNAAALRRMHETARAKGIPVLLVISPYLPLYASKMTNFESWKADLERRIGAEGQIHDFAGAVQDQAGFADGVHLSVAGRAEFLRVLLAAGLLDSARHTLGGTQGN